MPTDAEASEAIDLTLAEPVAAATALCLALHASGDVGSASEVPGFAQGRLAAVHFAISCSVASKHGSWGCEIMGLRNRAITLEILVATLAIWFFADLCRSPPQRAAQLIVPCH